MADTKLNLTEIELAIANSRKFNYVRNIVVFNIKGESEILPIHHECDILSCSKSGYLSEIEIKRSWTDFLADFKKRHDHISPLIKYFYYCVPVSIWENVNDKLNEEKRRCGIITYTEEGMIKIERESPILSYTKLFLEQQLELTRLGCMRIIGLKEKLNKLTKEENGNG